MNRIVLITILVFSTGFTTHASAQDLEAGLKSYERRCSQCHGLDGAADGPAADYMLPRPRVFKNNPVYKFRTTAGGELPTDQNLFDIITRGIPGSSMPSFDLLPEDERWDLVAAIKSFNEEETAFNDEEMLETALPVEELEIDPMTAPEATAESIAQGREVFLKAECNKCHGMNGRGNGASWNTIKDLWEDPILPRNLTNPENFRGGRRAYDIFRAISTGLSGSPMPAHRDDYTVEERWAAAHYVMSLGPVDKGQRDETIVATQVDEIPGEDAGWEDIEQFRFMTTANVIQPPRNFWATIEYVKAQAVYTEDEIALRIQWDDRSQSTGQWCVDGSKKDEICVTDEDCGTSTCGGEPIVDFEYPRETTDILHGTHHPDQFLVQFPVKTSNPSRRPYFMMGDSKLPVNLWWWRGDTNTLEDKNAKGARNITTQSEQSQTLDGGVSYEDGRYTMVIRRTLTTENARGDIQFEAGKFLPIAFQAWDGERGEVGQRRALTTWYWLYLRPAPEAAPAGLPGIRLNYAAPVAFIVSLLFLLGVFALIRRSHAANAGKEAEAAEDATETLAAS